MHIRFGGKTLECRADTTVAVALWENGVRCLSHSPKYGRPRGVTCARGHCTACLMRVDNIPNVRTCELSVREGMDIQRQDAGAFYAAPMQKMLAAGSAFFPVGFYYKWFTKPATVSRFFLDRIRPLTGVGRLPGAEHATRALPPAPDPQDPTAGPVTDLGRFDTVIVGAGPAGLAAAAKATGRVLILDDHEIPGGQRYGALRRLAEHQDKILDRFGVLGSTLERIEKLRDQFSTRDDVTFLHGTRAIAGYHPDSLLVRHEDRLQSLKFGTLIWAAGALDTLGLFPGNDTPGVLGPRALYRLLIRDGLDVKGKHVLIIGGGSEKVRDSVEVWDPATASSEPAGALVKGRKSHTATLLLDGRVLIVGSSRAIAEAEVWDPATSSSELAGQLAEGRRGHTATLLPDGRVLIIGGWKRPGWLASAEIWDPATMSFGPTGSLAEARVGHAATALPDGRVLVIGGHGADDYAIDSGNMVYPEEPRTLAEVWDPDTGTFSPAGTLAEGGDSHTATLLPDGRVLVVGGSSLLAEIWDPATASFGPAGWLTGGGETATALPDGRVLVVGGSSAEVWEPTMASFIPAGTLTGGGETATALPDGRVLVVGGGGRDVSSIAEIWEPRELPEEQMRELAAESLFCGELRASYREGTTGDPQLDREYLTRCLTCERLLALIQFLKVADMEMGLALYQERCDWPQPSPGSSDDP